MVSRYNRAGRSHPGHAERPAVLGTGGKQGHAVRRRELTYVASITPGTVLAVKAYQTLDGVRQLTLVPRSYYTVATQNYGSVTAVQVRSPQR